MRQARPTRHRPVRQHQAREARPKAKRQPSAVAPATAKVNPAVNLFMQAQQPKPRIPDGWSGGVRILGVDPGEHTGLAYFEDGQLMGMRECSSAQIPVLLQQLAGMVALVVFEDSRLAGEVWIAEGTLAKRLKMARNVGEIDAWCRLIEGTCAMYGIPCMGVPASFKAGGKRGKKLNAAAFERFTGYSGEPTNQHKRDAALIAWNYRKAKP